MARLSAEQMREYETIYVLKPEIEDDDAVTFIKKMMGIVDKHGGRHVQVTNWGRKKLAWERDRNHKGMYVHHHYLGRSELVREYERVLGIDENCLLRQTILLNKGVHPDERPALDDTFDPPPTRSDRREDRPPRRSDDAN